MTESGSRLLVRKRIFGRSCGACCLDLQRHIANAGVDLFEAVCASDMGARSRALARTSNEPTLGQRPRAVLVMTETHCRRTTG